MRITRSFILLFLGAVIVVGAIAMFDPSVTVQAQGCLPGVPCPTSPPEKKPRKTATNVPILLPTKTPTPTVTYTPTVTDTSTATPTATFTSTSTPTSTVTALPITGSGVGPNDPNSELPAVQDPDQGSSPNNFPGPLGTIIAVLLIGGLLFTRRRRLLGSTGEAELPFMERGGKENMTMTVRDVNDLDGELGSLPYLERGGKENVTISVRDVNDLDGELRNLPAIQRGVNENFTITVKDVGDISPDAGSNLGGDIQVPPGPPIKPPTPN